LRKLEYTIRCRPDAFDQQRSKPKRGGGRECDALRNVAAGEVGG
jgi:hypothetical protein